MTLRDRSAAICLAFLLSAAALPAHGQQLNSPVTEFRHVPAERAAQAAEGTEGRVFGGREVQEGEYPFQVALLGAYGLNDDPESQYESQFCGGTLIAHDWVLTAAHCMMDYGEPIAPESVVVLAGSTDLQLGQRMTVKQIFIHEQYDETSMDHDVALMQLDSAVDIPAIALDYDGAVVGPAIVTGWGLTEDGQYPRHLLSSDIDVVGNDICGTGIKAIYAADIKSAVRDLAARYKIGADQVDKIGDELAAGMGDPLTETMVCAGVPTGARDTCYGDSGGPLFAIRNGKPVQLGIVSWGEGPAEAEVKCGHADVYGVYSRIASFKDWIQSHIEPN